MNTITKSIGLSGHLSRQNVPQDNIKFLKTSFGTSCKTICPLKEEMFYIMSLKGHDKGHFFKNDCPDKVNYVVNNGRDMGEIDAVIKSGHRAKYADKHDVNGVSGHASGHDNTIKAIRCKTNSQSGH